MFDKGRFDALTIPDVVIKKGTRRGARHGGKRGTTQVQTSERLFQKSFKEQKKAPSSSGSNRAKRTVTTKKPADVLTALHAKTTPTSLLGKLALNIQGPTDFYESKIGLVLTQSKISATSDKKMIKSPILQFIQANKFANVQYGKTRRDGIQHPHRRIEEDHPHGGLLQILKNISDFSRLSLTGNSDSFVSDGRCKQHTAPRTTHTRKHFPACGSSFASFCCLS